MGNQRHIGKLTALQIAKAKAPGYLGDGGNLWVQVQSAGAKSWVLRFKSPETGKVREMGLGSTSITSLEEAREKRAEARQLLAKGIDPLAEQARQRATAALARTARITFKAEAEAFLKANEASWTNAKHRAQWRSTLETHVYPALGDQSIGDITVAQVIALLEPVWTRIPKTALALRGRIENVFDWAIAKGHRVSDNPARLSVIEKGLPAITKSREHHPAMKYAEVPEFVSALRARSEPDARMFEVGVLTCARTGELIGARWDEIDLDAKVWTVPADRMKSKREHRVPLSAPAMAILRDLYEQRASDFVFRGKYAELPPSTEALREVLRKMGRRDITAHGFRSSFRDWCGDCTSAEREVAEQCLAHSLGNDTERAYRRSDAFQKRAALMDQWAAYLAGEKRDNVVSIERRA